MNIECLQCKKPIKRKPYRIKKYQKQFCSIICHGIWLSENNKGSINGNWKGGVTIHTCQKCGKEYQYPARKSKYCSRECMVAAREKRILKECANCGKEFEVPACYDKRVSCCSSECGYALIRKRNTREVKCKGCGILFLPKRISQPGRVSGIKSTALFHNLECMLDWRSKIYSGEGNPRWLGGTVQYRGKDWSIQKHLAVKRDDFTCQLCLNIPELIHVHHIIPYRKEKNNSLENLISLCPSCHTTEENYFRKFGKPSLRIRRWRGID